MNEPRAIEAVICGDCGLPHAPALLSCPGCHRLTHGARLRELAAEAGELERGSQLSAALTTWRSALELLPRGTDQHRQVADRVEALAAKARANPEDAPARPSRSLAGKWAGIGAVGLLIWKFKAVILVVLSKAKWLLLGLSKGKTLLSMVAFAGVYWSLFGWWFAIGLVVGIYIHEMGHVAALKRLGIAASAPMFIPGFGAFVRMKQYPATPSEDAQVGLAGPIWGAAASIGFFLLHVLSGVPELAAIARFNAWINLFNLLPIGPLDGGRGMNAMDRRQRWTCVAALSLAFYASGDGLILLLILLGVYRAAMGAPAEKPDRRATWTYVALVAVLTAISQVPVPGVPS